MSKYYKADDVIRKRAEDLANTSYWEWGNPKNVDDWIEVAEMEFADLPTIEVMEYPQIEGITPTLITTEVSEDCISRYYVRLIESDEDAYFGDWNETYERGFSDAINKVLDAPSVVPDFKTFCGVPIEEAIDVLERYRSAPSRTEGEWYRQTTDHFDYWECSECGIGVGLDDIKNYCPNCGVRMEIEE